jgi:hypothetical protein
VKTERLEITNVETIGLKTPAESQTDGGFTGIAFD